MAAMLRRLGQVAISIRGDEAHPKCVNLLGLKITYGLWTIGVDRAMLHYSIG
jgi:hypothetical protein